VKYFYTTHDITFVSECALLPLNMRKIGCMNEQMKEILGDILLLCRNSSQRFRIIGVVDLAFDIRRKRKLLLGFCCKCCSRLGQLLLESVESNGAEVLSAVLLQFTRNEGRIEDWLLFLGFRQEWERRESRQIWKFKFGQVNLGQLCHVQSWCCELGRHSQRLLCSEDVKRVLRREILVVVLANLLERLLLRDGRSHCACCILNCGLALTEGKLERWEGRQCERQRGQRGKGELGEVKGSGSGNGGESGQTAGWSRQDLPESFLRNLAERFQVVLVTVHHILEVCLRLYQFVHICLRIATRQIFHATVHGSLQLFECRHLDCRRQSRDRRERERRKSGKGDEWRASCWFGSILTEHANRERKQEQGRCS
ncbi:hypothetical protein PMAYCL1PPCAC_19478, partial [Pristionchus mayeri]